MSRSESISAFAEQETADVDEQPLTIHSLALELADPPIEDFDAFCAIVGLADEATEHAIARLH